MCICNKLEWEKVLLLLLLLLQYILKGLRSRLAMGYPGKGVAKDWSTKFFKKDSILHSRD